MKIRINLVFYHLVVLTNHKKHPVNLVIQISLAIENQNNRHRIKFKDNVIKCNKK